MTTTSSPPSQNRGIDAGLLLLRIGIALPLFLLFGLQKLQAGWAFLHTGQWEFVEFNRKIGLPAPVLIAWFQALNESLVALLLACGLFSRYAAAALAIGFAGATACSLKASEPAWMTAAFFFVVFASLLLTGPGNLSLDALLNSKTASRVDAPSTAK